MLKNTYYYLLFAEVVIPMFSLLLVISKIALSTLYYSHVVFIAGRRCQHQHATQSVIGTCIVDFFSDHVRWRVGANVLYEY